MSLNRDQFAVVLAALRARFRLGEWVEGEPLTVADLATECGVSATPVREALARLAGEGLVEDRRGRGYYARRIDSADLTDLYSAQEALAHIAIDLANVRRAALGPEPVPTPDAFLTDPARTWEGLFETLMRAGNAGYLMSELRRLADRLAPARGAEPQVLLEETAADFAPVISGLAASDWNAVARGLLPLFEHRRSAVDQLVMRLRLSAGKYKSRIY